MINANSHFVTLYSLKYIQFCLLVYSLLEQQIKLVLTTYILEQVKGYDSLIKAGTKVQDHTGH